MSKEIIDKIKEAVVNYRNYRLETFVKLDQCLQPYVNGYFEKANLHFERVMDICISVPECMALEIADEKTLLLTHGMLQFTIDLSSQLSEHSIIESQNAFDVVKRIKKSQS